MEVPSGYRFKEETLIPGYGKKVLFENEKGQIVVKLVAEKASPPQQPIGGLANAATKPSFPNPPQQQKNLQQKPPPQSVSAAASTPQQVLPPTPRIEASPKQFIAKMEPRVDEKDAYILALNIYHESASLRGPNNKGWRSVAAVVFNRLDDNRFPKTVEGVVNEVRAGVCQFSWRCDGIPDQPKNQALFAEIFVESKKYLREHREGKWIDPVSGAHSYHANTVGPDKYFRNLQLVATIADGKFAHYFYRDRRFS
jgi:N-acetylmuramoyl-L-alanine amidase